MVYTAQKKKSFPLKISSVNVTKSANQETGDFVTFTEEFLKGKLNLLCGVVFKQFMTQ